MKRRPDQGAEPPEQEQGKDEERLRVREKSSPSKFEPGTTQWWQEREDQPGDIHSDPDKR